MESFLERISREPGISDDWKLTSARLSELVQMPDMHPSFLFKNPRAFFDAHLALTRYPNLEAFSVKFTVHYNLFCGSVLSLGTPKHKAMLDTMGGELGAFLLTEYSTGVLSGGVCNTQAHFRGTHFELITPGIVRNTDGTPDPVRTLNRKNWISQGLSAKWGVVVADIVRDEKSYGHHAFLINLNTDGITRADNGRKTGLNGIDNAIFIFDSVQVPVDAIMHDDPEQLFSDHVRARRDGFPRIARRLNSGRLCIALMTNEYMQSRVRELGDSVLQKQIFLAPGRQTALGDLPHVRDSVVKMSRELREIRVFLDAVVAEYCKTATEGQDISTVLIDRIIAAKILSVNHAIHAANTLRVKMGAASLFADNQLGSNLDILLCSKFAEGDNSVLLRKLVFDRITTLKRTGTLALLYRRYVMWQDCDIIDIAFRLASASDPVLESHELYEAVDAAGMRIVNDIVAETIQHM